MNLLDVIPVALLGAVLGLDVVSFPQAMVSRPLVAATLGGALVGHSESGLLIGAALELIALETLPFGASRYPEWGSAAVVGGVLFANHSDHPPGSMGVAMLGALATAWIGGWTMVKLRELNAVWARSRRDAIDAGSGEAVVAVHLLGMCADFFRGGALTAVAYIALAPVANATIATWGVDARVSRAVVVSVAASVAAGAAWKLFHGVSHARWYFGAGLLIGFLSLVSK